MPDLLTELRNPAVAMTEKSLGDLCREAADRIEKLEGALKHVEQLVKNRKVPRQNILAPVHTTLSE